jgi:hypothetical protein
LICFSCCHCFLLSVGKRHSLSFSFYGLKRWSTVVFPVHFFWVWFLAAAGADISYPIVFPAQVFNRCCEPRCRLRSPGSAIRFTLSARWHSFCDLVIPVSPGLYALHVAGLEPPICVQSSDSWLFLILSFTSWLSVLAVNTHCVTLSERKLRFFRVFVCVDCCR